ncbi:MAG: MBL fold metallo-hydrolase, partial [Thermoplasmata archaeon]
MFNSISIQLLKEKLEKLGIKKVEFIINTHAHTDHTGGNSSFEEAKVIMQKDWREVKKYEFWFGKEELIKKPDVEFEDQYLLEYAPTRIEAKKTGGHSFDHCVVLMNNILFCGDLLVSNRHDKKSIPYFYYTSPSSFRNALTQLRELILTLKPKYIVPGHGVVIDCDSAMCIMGFYERYLDLLNQTAPELYKCKEDDQMFQYFSLQKLFPETRFVKSAEYMHERNLVLIKQILSCQNSSPDRQK